MLFLLKNDERAPADLRKKSLEMAGIMLEMGGKAKPGKGVMLATSILESGDAYKKMVEIIKAQGKKQINPDRIKIGRFVYDHLAQRAGKIRSISNECISKIARIAGAPEDAGAGIYLHAHVGDKVKKGEPIFTLFAHNEEERGFASEACARMDGVVVK